MAGNPESRIPDPEAAARRQAQERGAAPVSPGGAPQPKAPLRPTEVEETAPITGARVRAGGRGARTFESRKGKKKTKDAPSGEASPDPRGKGTNLDTRV